MYGLKTKKIYLSSESVITKSLERYRDLYYNGIRNEEVIWLTMLTARNFSELYEFSKEILNEEELKKLMEASINMSKDGFVIHAWQKEKMDALVKYNEIKKKKKEGKAEGIAEGIKENKIEIAQNMLKKKMSIKDISEITGLTEQDIQNFTQNGNV